MSNIAIAIAIAIDIVFGALIFSFLLAEIRPFSDSPLHRIPPLIQMFRRHVAKLHRCRYLQHLP